MIDDLQPKLPEHGDENSMDKKEWKTVQKLLYKADKQRKEKEREWLAIKQVDKDQFGTQQRVGHKYIRGKLLFMLIWRVSQKMKLPDPKVTLQGGSPLLEMVIQHTLEQGIRETGLQRVYMDKSGVRDRILKYGDTFVESGIVEKGFPTRFRNTSLSEIWIDPFAIEFHNESSIQDADWCASMKTYSWDEFIRIYKKAGVKPGKLPIDKADEDSDDYTDEQSDEMAEREIQVITFSNKIWKKEFVFAGSNAKLVEKLEGEAYPHKDRQGEPALPLIHFLCFPSEEGFYNNGLGSLFYDLHMLSYQIFNKAIAALSRNIHPIGIMRIKKNQESRLKAKFDAALVDKAKGGEGVVMVEEQGGEPTTYKIESLIGEQMTQEFERLTNEIDKIIKRLGINIDDIFPVSGQTATEASIREEATTEFILSITEKNEMEIIKAYEKILTDIRDHISPDDDTPIKDVAGLQKKMDAAGLDRKAKEITLGMASMVLKKFQFYVETPGRTGAFPNLSVQAERKKQIVDTVASINPQAPAMPQLMADFLNTRGTTVDPADLAMPQNA